MRSLIILFLGFFLWSCEDVKHPDMDDTMQELQNRKIVRLLDSDIESHAGELGRMCLNKLQVKSLDSVQLYLEEGNKGVLKHVSSKEEAVLSVEKLVWEAYKYSLDNNLPLDMNLQKTAEGNFIINEPILENSVLVGMWSLQLNREYVVQDISRN